MKIEINNLVKIIRKIQYPRRTIHGNKYFCNVDTLIDEINKENL